MIDEAPMSETVILFTINAITSMVCSQLHKTLYFLLGLTFWAMHFGHYFLTFLVLCALTGGGFFPRHPRLPFKDLWPLVATECVLSVATCIIHTGGSDGAVHSIRVTDFVVTLGIIFSAKYFIDKEYYLPTKSKYTLLLIAIAISSSVAWMEPILFINYKTALAWPVVVITTSLHFMLVFQLAQKTKINPVTLTWQLCGFTSLILSPLAFIFTSDAFSNDTQDITSSWETIDYLSILMACFFVSGMIISKYMLICKLTPESFAVTRHSKYLMGAFGQWLLQNMAHVTLLSVFGKFVATATISLYCFRRFKERRLINKPIENNINGLTGNGNMQITINPV